MTGKRKVGRPRKMKSGEGCHRIVIYHKVKGIVRKVKGYPKKLCLTKK